MEPCLRKVLLSITPGSLERERVDAIAQRVLRSIKSSIEELHEKNVVLVEYEGSYAKDTWLAGELDLDLFIYYRKGVSLEELSRRTLKIVEGAAKVLGARIDTRYASHPYYTLVLREGVEVDVVPAFYVEKPEEIVTPVDRTRLHTIYVRKKLEEKPGLKGHIRLLKKLMKVAGIYGAEHGINGFSGYLCEILIIYFGGLRALLEEAASWRPWETYVPSRDLGENFRSPLVVVDPVDPRRNAAAAVSEESMAKFVAIARLSEGGRKGLCCVYSTYENGYRLKHDGRWVVVKAEPLGPYSPQEIAGMLDRHRRRIVRAAEREGFLIGRSRVVAPKISGKEGYLVFEVIAGELPPLYLHRGPPVYSPSSVSFVEKWISNDKMPFIRGSRWFVPLERPYTSFLEFLGRVLYTERRFTFTLLSGEYASRYVEEVLRHEAWIKCFRRTTL